MRVAWLVGAAAVLAALAPGRADDGARACLLVTAKYAQFNKMASAGDPSTWPHWLRAHTTPDFQIRANGRTVSRAQILAEMDAVTNTRSDKAHYARISGSAAVLSVKAAAGKVIVMVRSHLVFVWSAPTRKRYNVTETRRETWVRVGSDWKLQLREMIARKQVAAPQPTSSRTGL